VCLLRSHTETHIGVWAALAGTRAALAWAPRRRAGLLEPPVLSAYLKELQGQVGCWARSMLEKQVTEPTKRSSPGRHVGAAEAPSHHSQHLCMR
jgi:hypothetical protein